MKNASLAAAIAGFCFSAVFLFYGGFARWDGVVFALLAGMFLRIYFAEVKAESARESDAYKAQHAEILEVFSPRRDIEEALAALPATYTTTHTREIGFIDGGFRRFERICVSGANRFIAIIDVEGKSVSRRRFIVARENG